MDELFRRVVRAARFDVRRSLLYYPVLLPVSVVFFLMD